MFRARGRFAAAFGRGSSLLSQRGMTAVMQTAQRRGWRRQRQVAVWRHLRGGQQQRHLNVDGLGMIALAKDMDGHCLMMLEGRVVMGTAASLVLMAWAILESPVLSRSGKPSGI